jgi:Sec-independent protein secretion pathway component TatC
MGAIKVIFKNILFFLIGAALGFFMVIRFVLPYALSEAMEDSGPGEIIVAAIALTPMLLIVYGLLGIFIGGFGVVIIYNLTKLILRKSK